MWTSIALRTLGSIGRKKGCHWGSLYFIRGILIVSEIPAYWRARLSDLQMMPPATQPDSFMVPPLIVALPE